MIVWEAEEEDGGGVGSGGRKGRALSLSHSLYLTLAIMKQHCVKVGKSEGVHEKEGGRGGLDGGLTVVGNVTIRTGGKPVHTCQSGGCCWCCNATKS